MPSQREARNTRSGAGVLRPDPIASLRLRLHHAVCELMPLTDVLTSSSCMQPVDRTAPINQREASVKKRRLRIYPSEARPHQTIRKTTCISNTPLLLPRSSSLRVRRTTSLTSHLALFYVCTMAFLRPPIVKFSTTHATALMRTTPRSRPRRSTASRKPVAAKKL